MKIDTDRIDDAVLALLSLTLYEGVRTWKGHDWDVLARLHAKATSSIRSASKSPSCCPTADSRNHDACSISSSASGSAERGAVAPICSA
jgi:hypothetical protein